MKKLTRFIAVYLFCLFTSSAQAQYVLDNSFGINGEYFSSFLGFDNVCNDMLVQPDGKVVMVVDGPIVNNFFVIRLTETGALDNSFGGTGVLNIDFSGDVDKAKAVDIDAAGNLYVAGTVTDGGEQKFGMVKISPEGLIDASFGGTGKFIVKVGLSGYPEQPMDVLVNPSGEKVYIAGEAFYLGVSHMAVVKLDANTGQLDSSFNSNGVRKININGSSSANSIVLTGTDLYVVGFSIVSNEVMTILSLNDEDGSNNISFGASGIAIYDISSGFSRATDAKTDAFGKLVVGGYLHNGSHEEAFAARIALPSHNLDNSFDGDGIVTHRFGTASISRCHQILIDYASNKVTLCGYSNTSGSVKTSFLRVNPNGSPDGTFGLSGVLQPTDGKVFAAQMYFDNIFAAGTENYLYPLYENGMVLKLKPNSGGGSFAAPAIEGSDSVNAHSENSFNIKNKQSYYTYHWSYSDPTVTFSPNNTSDFVFAFFPANASSGVLTCQIDSSGIPKYTLTKNIVVVPFSIAGPRTVFESSLVTYKLLPGRGEFEYQWSYSDINILMDFPRSPWEASIKFLPGVASSGTLTVIISYLGTPIDTVTANITVEKFDLNFFIVGKETVNKNKVEFYRVQPYDELLYYRWKYVADTIAEDSVMVIVDSGPRASLFFPSQAPSGTLKCYVHVSGPNSAPSDSAEIKITINKGLNNLASLLEELDCQVEPANCSNAHINNFEVRGTKIKTTNTGCKKGAFSDYTATQYNDTLYLGEVYLLTIQAGGANKSGAYYGVWIDYDNDGAFNDEYELMASSFVADSMFKSDYLIIKNNNDYAGNPARLRVRVRTDKPFVKEEYCQKEPEEGETEDYFVFLMQREKLQTPNFITPNNDGKNDIFVVRGINPDEPTEFKVYNPVGELVFNTTNYENNWSGTNNRGEPLEKNTYYFIFTNGKESKKGFFEIRK
ncbi:MAG: gliding motility-associated C-terminal domain-containing protein [Cytophagaceae bacterium]|nr:gliding motility-associated C-terminal domain-containing protein [Cytophagaceae bacterium]MDW8456326.1 gliding motility-associated C-terminal domain-containing protein [Cytophagaceae bacterium]